MITIPIDIDRLPKFIPIGRQGENNYRCVSFDTSKWLAEYPSSAVSVVFKRGDGTIYPVVINQMTSPAVWVMTSTDTSVSGYGAVEIRISTENMLGKRAVIKTYTESALGEIGEAPPQQTPDWVQAIAENAESAELSRLDAETAKYDAESACAAAEAATGHYPHIGEDKHWYVWHDGAWVDTGVVAVGVNGTDGADGTNGIDGVNGADGQNGTNGADGADGVGIETAEIDGTGNLIITRTDGAEINTGNIVQLVLDALPDGNEVSY